MSIKNTNKIDKEFNKYIMNNLPKELEMMIYKMSTSMTLFEINQDIKNLQRKQIKADDIFIENRHPYFWNDDHNVYAITTNKSYNIKPIHLDYLTYRNLGFQWTYICNDCGEYLKVEQDRKYHCNCNSYLF